MATDRVPLTKPQETISLEETIKGHEGVWEGTLTYMDDINYHRMAEFLSVNLTDRRDSQIAEKIGFLADWAKLQTHSDDLLEHKIAIKELIGNLGYQMQGRELITKLYHWVRLDQDRKRIEKEIEIEKEKPTISEPEMQIKDLRIKPINTDEVKLRIGEQMKDVSTQIKSEVKRHITSSINKGIKEAIQGIQPK